jgi:polyhydroxybutyrate depolymerase
LISSNDLEIVVYSHLLLISVLAIAADPGTKVDVPIPGSPNRTYFLHEPPASAPVPIRKTGDKSLRPVVFVFHPYSSTADETARITGFNDLADKEGFIVVWPVGQGLNGKLGWNAGSCCVIGLDDVDFFVAMLKDLAGRLKSADLSQVYVTGMSNGAMLCHKLASDGRSSGNVRALATVAGTIAVPATSTQFLPAAQPPKSILHVHGTADPIVLYVPPTTPNDLRRMLFSGVDQTIDAWKQANKCTVALATQPSAPMPGDPTTFVRVTSSPASGAAGASVILYTIAGGGHTWPGRAKADQEMLSYSLPGASDVKLKLGVVSMSFDATQVIWDFFKDQ